MKKISCIIPAYNEGKRIASVLDIVIGHPLISEVIVVDDGSSDDTRDVVARYSSIKLIALEKNGGKSAAIVEGVRQAENELILFLDADLSGLSANALSSLIEPVQSGKADVSISLRHNSPLQWRLMGLDYISGERVFSKNFLMPLLPSLLSINGFGLEVYLNRAIIKQRLRIAVVWWSGVHSAFKYTAAQEWWYFGIKKDYIRMFFLVMRTITPFEMARQIIQMLRLRRVYKNGIAK